MIVALLVVEVAVTVGGVITVSLCGPLGGLVAFVCAALIAAVVCVLLSVHEERLK